MRFYNPPTGTKRIIKKFALFPFTIRQYTIGVTETRWLEKIIVEQQWEGDYWRNMRFINEEKNDS